MSNAVLEQPQATADLVTEKASRRRKSPLAQEVSAEVATSVIALYAKSATIVEVANQFSIAPTVVRNFLAAEGVLRGRGQSANRATRKTLVITPDILAQAMISFPKIGVVASAKNLNVSAVGLSEAIKLAGGVIQRGRPTKG